MTREEAIEVYNGLINIRIKEAFEFFAPELKVSEDERVIEMLRIAVKQTAWLDEDKNRCYRWLDKQVEKSKFKNLITQEERDAVFEQKPALDIEIPFGAKDSELQKASYHIPEGFHAEIEGNRVVIKRGEQKPNNWIQELEDKLANATPKQLAEWKEKYFKEEPAEWSEEDKLKMDTLVHIITKQKGSAIFEGFLPEELIGWLWSFKDRVQPQAKQEWSEEDENMRGSLLGYLNGFSVSETAKHQMFDWLKSLKPQKQFKWSEEDEKIFGDINYALEYVYTEGNKLEKYQEFLKSLRPQSQWKPSDEEIKQLNITVKMLNPNRHDQHVLMSLLEQLKKLKG